MATILPKTVFNSPHYASYLSGNPADVQRPVSGGTVLMGGGTDVDEAFRYLIERSGGGDFLVLRASGADGYNDYVNGLGTVDSVESVVFQDRQASYDPAITEKIDGAEAIFLAGGDQAKYLEYWKNSPVQEALQRAIDRGVPIGGTSAGLAVLGECIFSAENGTVDSSELLLHPNSDKLTLQRDFLAVDATRGTLTDTHFSQRDRMGRLVAFLAAANRSGGEIRGLGVDEKTAVLAEKDGTARVVGSSNVYWVRPTQKAEPGEPLNFKGLEVHEFQPGHSFNLQDWDSVPSPPKTMFVENGVLR